MSDHTSIQTQPCPICNAPGQYAYTGKDLLCALPGEFHYATCSRCKTVYQTPMPDMETIASFYPDDYDVYRPAKAKARNPLQKAVLRTTYGYRHLSSSVPDWIGRLVGTLAYRNSIPYKTDGRLLDIGCGSGKFLLSMQQLGWQAQGVEFNTSAVEICRDAGLEIFRGELAAATFPDNHFDLVTARHLIEHIADPKPLIKEIFRILKPGSIMVLVTPNSQALGRGWFGTNWYANDVPRHLTLFNPNNLQQLAAQAGFQKVAIRTSSSPKIFLNSWDYLTHNTGKPSKHRKIRRFFARAYVLAAALSRSGDEIFAIFQKP